MKNSIMVVVVFLSGCVGGAEPFRDSTANDGGDDGTSGDTASSSSTDSDSDTDSGSDVDNDTDVDSDSDGDADTGTGITSDTGDDTGSGPDTDTGSDTGTGTEWCLGYGVWKDSTTGLCWENPSGTVPMKYPAAVNHCAGLDIGGSSNWRVPTISELRTTIYNCPYMITGGVCRVTDQCSNYSECYDVPSCSGGQCKGPVDVGCLWSPYLDGPCYDAKSNSSFHWSKTPCSLAPDLVWVLMFGSATMTLGYTLPDADGGAYIRCVH